MRKRDFQKKQGRPHSIHEIALGRGAILISTFLRCSADGAETERVYRRRTKPQPRAVSFWVAGEDPADCRSNAEHCRIILSPAVSGGALPLMQRADLWAVSPE